MKKIIFLALIFPGLVFASVNHSPESLAIYQERCAKEQDPVKRQGYCNLLEKGARALHKNSRALQDIAIV